MTSSVWAYPTATSVTTGSTMWCATSSTYPRPVVSPDAIPPVGNMPGTGPRPTEKTMISSSPSQNDGTDQSVSATPVLTRSPSPPLRQAERVPSQSAERRVEHHGRAGQQQRRGQLLGDQLADRGVELVRGAQVAGERRAAVVGELVPQRQVEPELPAQCGELRR